VRLLWEYESGVLADVRALRKTVTRRGDVRGASSTPPGRAGCPAGNVPEVPQIVPRRKQVLRVLRHTFAGCTPPGGASARGTPSARRTACSAETCCSPPATRGPACGSPSTASGGSADTACGEARSASAAASCSSEARGSAARAARSAGCQAAFTPTASSPCSLTGRDRGF
jgi:hypothetical protein